MIQIYYGDGKGKTTAAIGAGMRATGAGKSVLLIQFLKDNKSSELSVLPFDIFDAPDSLPFNPDDSYIQWVNGAVECVKNSDHDMIILDEFIDIIPRFLSINEAISLLSCGEKEYVITGHRADDELFKIADYITLVSKQKHPFDNGAKARFGIEY